MVSRNLENVHSPTNANNPGLGIQTQSLGPVPVKILIEAIESKPRVRAKLEARLKAASEHPCDLDVLAEVLAEDCSQQEPDRIALIRAN